MIPFHAPTARGARALHPHAAIIRELGPGRYVAFRTAEDARGHESARPFQLIEGRWVAV